MKICFAFMKYFWALFMLTALVSCQTLGIRYPGSYSQPHIDDETARLLATIKNMNHTLETFKGIGNFKLVNPNKTMNLRAAWMGTDQGNFRVEIFGFPGQSAARYSNDGHASYLYFPLEDRFYIIDNTNPNLEKILTISITSNELNYFLSGRIPISGYNADQASIDVSEEGYELSLKKGCFGKLKKIYLDKLNKKVWKVEAFNLFGSLKYRTELYMKKSIDGYSIPFEIIISNNDGNRLHIFIDKYWTDIAIPFSSFTLTPPH